MLRPSTTSILGSTRGERRRNQRRETMRAVGQTARTVGVVGTGVTAGVFGLLLPWAVPILYLAAAFLFLALPLRWATGRAPLTLLATGEWLLAAAISAIGVFRAAQSAAPVAPVRPQFARGLLVAGWGAALVLALAELWP